MVEKAFTITRGGNKVALTLKYPEDPEGFEERFGRPMHAKAAEAVIINIQGRLGPMVADGTPVEQLQELVDNFKYGVREPKARLPKKAKIEQALAAMDPEKAAQARELLEALGIL